MSTIQSTRASTEFTPEWRDPADEQAFWFRDILHNPAPITPLNATLFQPAFSAGASRAIAKLSMPITGIRSAVHHGYVFLAPSPFMGTPEQMEERFGGMQRLTMELGATVLKDWRETFEPLVLELARQLQTFDYAGSSTRDVASFVVAAEQLITEVWDIHMRVNIPPMNAVFGLEMLLEDVLGPDAIPQARQLLQGFDNKSVETGRATWALSRWVRSVDGLAGAVRNARVHGGAVDIGAHAANAEFQERWQAFLDIYGWRSDIFMELGHPSWREDPSSALTQLKRYAGKPDGEDPFLAHLRQAEDRERLTGELEGRLPEALRPQFRGMLMLAQQYVPIAEDHNFTIDQKFTMVTRGAILELGKKLVADGAFANPEDVFYLVLDEIKEIAAGGKLDGLRAAARERRQERVAQGRLTPPPGIGTPPPADMPPDPLVTKFFGFGIEQGGDPKVVTGYPCSAGTVTGIARVVLTLDDADRVEPGDILVCPMTMPAWTPLFGVAGAVVADAGGPLSHCAIVAREYQIPCVAGTGVGTTVIKDGSRITVDGGTGTIRILD